MGRCKKSKINHLQIWIHEERWSRNLDPTSKDFERLYQAQVPNELSLSCQGNASSSQPKPLRHVTKLEPEQIWWIWRDGIQLWFRRVSIAKASWSKPAWDWDKFAARNKPSWSRPRSLWLWRTETGIWFWADCFISGCKRVWFRQPTFWSFGWQQQ